MWIVYRVLPQAQLWEEWCVKPSRALGMSPRWQTANVVRGLGQSAFLFPMEYRDGPAINANAATQGLPAASQDFTLCGTLEVGTIYSTMELMTTLDVLVKGWGPGFAPFILRT